MLCTVCGTNFEAKRADAKFCGSTCRSKASRGITPESVMEGIIEENRAYREEVQSQEKSAVISKPLKKCERSERCCDECVDFELTGIHWCPNEKCGCFETKEEQEASIRKFEESCPHVLIAFNRCTRCLKPVFTPNKEIDWEEEKKKLRPKK